MSQISILGFTPLSPPDGSPGSLHWSILLSPADDGALTKGKHSKNKSRTTSRFFPHHRHQSGKAGSESTSTSTLFDVQDHQLRQQAFPVPVAAAVEASEEDSESDSDSHSTMSTNTASLYPRTTTTISSSSSSAPHKPLHLRLRIKLCTHPSAPPKLAPKLSALMYGTPTYGPADDWLHAALEEVIYSGMLEAARPPIVNVLDADAILHFAQEVARPVLSEAPADHHHPQVHEFDYEAHLARNAELRAMFGHATPSPSGSRPGSVRHSSHKSAGSSKDGTHRFWGFRISPSPGSLQPDRQDHWVAERRVYGRRDDPYAGLM